MIKRPMVWFLGCYLIGLLCAWYQSLSVFLFLLLIILGGSLYLLLWGEKSRWTIARVNQEFGKIGWLMPILLLLGYYVTNLSMKVPELEHEFQEKINCTISGEISMVVLKNQKQVLYVNDVIIDLNDQQYTCETIILYPAQLAHYRVGNHITATGSLQKFSVATNPGQFNEKMYYQIENMDYKMYGTEVMITDGRYSIYHGIINGIKERIAQVFESVLEPAEAGVLIGMLLGDKYLLEDEIEDLYSKNGIAHVIAISGMHLSLLGMTFYHLLKKIKVPLYLSVASSMFLVFSYGVLTDFSVSTKRAVIMMIVLLFGDVVGRSYDMMSATALSGFLILLDNPLQLFHAGFVLSYSAIFGIGVLYPAMKELIRYDNSVVDGILVSLCAQIATLPAVLFFFYQAPSYGLLVNMIVLPFVSCLMLSGLLAGVLGCIWIAMGVFMVGSANYLLEFYEWICRIGISLPGSLITVGKPSMVRMGLFLLLMVAFLIGAKVWKKRWTLILLLLSVLVLFLPVHFNQLEITMLDVGQGDCIFIRTPYGTTYLVDGGSSNVKGVGTYRMEPFLLSQGISEVDYVIITHYDTDHVIGIQELIKEGNVKVGELVLPKGIESEKEKNDSGERYFTSYYNHMNHNHMNQNKMNQNQMKATQDSMGKYENDSKAVSAAETLEEQSEFELLAREYGISVSYIGLGNGIKEGDFFLQCLHPVRINQNSGSNASSVVLSIHYGDFDMLLTGDLEGSGEEDVLQHLKEKSSWQQLWNGRYSRENDMEQIDYDVLKVAHHGSKNSSSESFLDTVNPEWALISCSKRNSYGHPHPELIERLDQQRIKKVGTYDGGAILIRTDGYKMVVKSFLE